MPLITAPNLDAGDDFYEALLAAHHGLDADASAAFNARLILLMANHIGRQDVLLDALAAASRASPGAHRITPPNAALPLMGTEFVLGEKLYNDANSGTSSAKGAHIAIGTSLVGVFSVQAVTGVMNLMESRQAPGGTKRLIHGLMMLAAGPGTQITVEATGNQAEAVMEALAALVSGRFSEDE